MGVKATLGAPKRPLLRQMATSFTVLPHHSFSCCVIRIDEFLAVVTVSGRWYPPGVLEYHSLASSVTLVGNPFPIGFVKDVINSVLESNGVSILQSGEVRKLPGAICCIRDRAEIEQRPSIKGCVRINVKENHIGIEPSAHHTTPHHDTTFTTNIFLLFIISRSVFLHHCSPKSSSACMSSLPCVCSSPLASCSMVSPDIFRARRRTLAQPIPYLLLLVASWSSASSIISTQ
jgi:hypothetical protein